MGFGSRLGRAIGLVPPRSDGDFLISCDMTPILGVMEPGTIETRAARFSDRFVAYLLDDHRS